MLGYLTSRRWYTIQWYDAKIWAIGSGNDIRVFLAHCHELFVAGPPTIFTRRERKVVADFAEDFYTTHATNVE